MFIKLTLQNGECIHINMRMIESFGRITETTYPDCADSVGMTYLVPGNDNNKVYVGER